MTGTGGSIASIRLFVSFGGGLLCRDRNVFAMQHYLADATGKEQTEDRSGYETLLLSGGSGILLSDSDGSSPRYKQMSYYHSRKSKLLKDFDATANGR